MDSLTLYDTILSSCSFTHFRGRRLTFRILCLFLLLNIDPAFANSEDPDETLHSRASLQIRVRNWFFLISQPKRMLRVLKRTASMRRFFWAPRHMLKLNDRVSYQFYAKKSCLTRQYDLCHFICWTARHGFPINNRFNRRISLLRWILIQSPLLLWFLRYGLC